MAAHSEAGPKSACLFVSLTFAVHSVSGTDGDDLVGLSWPLAVMGFGSGERRVVTGTENIALARRSLQVAAQQFASDRG
jgi:hypothetical protein